MCPQKSDYCHLLSQNAPPNNGNVDITQMAFGSHPLQLLKMSFHQPRQCMVCD